MRSPRALTATAAVLPLLLLLAACSPSSPAATPSRTTSSSMEDAFPVTLDNCGQQIVIDHAPRRIVLVNNDALSNLEALDAVDRIVAVTATPDPDLYSAATTTAVAKLDVLSTRTNSTGGSVVSQEAVLGARPDLVIAPENAVDRAALADAGIPLYSPTAYCTTPPPQLSQHATFDRIWNDLHDFGAMLGVPQRAAAVTATAKRRIARLNSAKKGTAAAIYVGSGGAVLYPYGGPSMVTPVFAAVGLTNIYADAKDRVFEVSTEDLLSRNPDTIVLLTSAADADATRKAFLATPGIDGLKAVRQQRVITLPFSYTDPPSVLSTEGPQRLLTALADLP